VLNALTHNKDLGWAIITHPFHPFRGQRFRVLKTRKVAGEDTMILQGSYRGTFAVPRDWTDHANPNPYARLRSSAAILDFRCLLALTQLLERIEEKRVDE